MSRGTSRLVYAFCVFLASGCSPAGLAGVGEMGDAGEVEVLEIDVPPVSALETIEPDERDAQPDWMMDSGWVKELSEEGEPEQPGAFGRACDDDRDCQAGLCVDVGSGRVCSRLCAEECEPGFHCGAIEGHADLYCLPDFLPQCRPCQTGEECRRFHKDDSMVCVLVDSLGGQFCLAKCGEGQVCPHGTECDESGSCLPTEGKCDCRGAATNLGYSGNCRRLSSSGACWGEVVCGEEGLTACSAAEPEEDVCDGADNDCNGKTDDGIAVAACEHSNEWGQCPGESVCVEGTLVCQGAVPVAESCNGKDDDCDGEVDEEGAWGCSVYHADSDGDGYGGAETRCLCSIQSGWLGNGLDCDDQDGSVNPSQAEVCDGKDSDCDSVVDDGCDQDGDGYCGKPAVAFGPGLPCRFGELDCLDIDAQVYPTHEEWCDGLDNDCNGAVDEECDMDGDGYCGKPVVLWGPGLACAQGQIDCDDLEPTIHPNGAEVCDGRDNDCDSKQDEECDVDGDGYCAGQAPLFFLLCALTNDEVFENCSALLSVCPKGFGDCKPLVAWANPGAWERCNGVDDNCNGEKDELVDQDGDLHCAAGVVVEAGCTQCFALVDDCDDTEALVYPGAVDWPDLDGVDSNCDGLDGTIEGSVFVDVLSGSDSWPGTMEAPKATIGAGLAEASASATRRSVLVSVGSYPGSVNMKEGVRLWGGYDAQHGWTLSATEATVLETGSIGIKASGAVATTVVGRLRVETEMPQVPGGESLGVLGIDSPGLMLEGLTILAAAGASGYDGTAGTDGEAGEAGDDGTNGCVKGLWGACYNPWSDNTCATEAAGGDWYGSPRCGGAGHGMEEMAVTGQWSPAILAAWDPLMQAEPSCCYRVLGASKGGAPGYFTNSGAAPGTAGGKGVVGPNGGHGQGGEGKGSLNSYGWQGGRGDDGEPGGWGCGGGGGGLGDNNGGVICDYKGGGGGGGGAGGKGGNGGLGGGPGGGSVGVVLVRSPARITACRVETGGGGKGGMGGGAGAGGAGGKGGKGGSGLEGSGHGGAGGAGGSGGRGGVGGGGQGGASCGVIFSGGYEPLIEGLEVDLGPAGAGGAAGTLGPEIPASQIGAPPGGASKGHVGPKLATLEVL